jgi:pimeloyl-ACP methyl ester carboxylesterase
MRTPSVRGLPLVTPTFVLVPGAGGQAWYWHRLVPELERRGCAAVAVDLPADDDSAGLAAYADTVVAAAADAEDVVLVAQSMGGLTAPLVCDRLPVRLLVLLNAMVPRPGETGGAWWAATGHADPGDPTEAFFDDVPADVAAAAQAEPFEQTGRPFEDPWPLDRWPDVPTRVLVARDDRFFPLEFQRRVAADRLGLPVDEVPGGHLVALGRPVELAGRLVAYLTG